MADLQQFQVNLTGQSGVQVPRASISFIVTDSGTGAVILDKTGANAVDFPAVLRDLTDERYTALVTEIIAPWVAFELAGLNAGAALSVPDQPGPPR